MADGRLSSFGRVAPPAKRVLDHAEAVKLLRSGRAPAGGLLAFGNGRTYGDSCLNADGAAIDARGSRRILSVDPRTGVIEAEAGALLSEIIAHAAPVGFFPAVVPGTRFVTLGGAIANDIHGKNHHRRGTFGCHVLSLELLRSDGRTYRCSPASHPALFRATIGGMGLTGLILSATIRLMPVSSPAVAEAARPFRNLDEYFALAEQADEANEYAVAWVDQLAGGRRRGRGVLLTGNHAPAGTPVPPAGRELAVPFRPPVNLLHPLFLRLFNAAYRRSRTRSARRIGSPESFFFPLDGVRDWNRLYGPRGLHQHQSVVPAEAAPAVIPALLDAARRAGQGSFLTVLKRFGAVASPGLLSFPRPGYTLTLDFPHRGADTLRLLDRLDRMTVEAGGAVNPYKDARMSAETFAASFPRWRLLEAERDPAFLSGFWARTALSLDAPAALAAE